MQFVNRTLITLRVGKTEQNSSFNLFVGTMTKKTQACLRPLLLCKLNQENCITNQITNFLPEIDLDLDPIFDVLSSVIQQMQ